MAKKGFTKREVYACFIAFSDAKTANVIYSDSSSSIREGFFGALEKDLLKLNYKDQVILIPLIETMLPSPHRLKNIS